MCKVSLPAHPSPSSLDQSGVNADFTGRVAIVTGAARGLGRAAAERLHERGASVVVHVRDQARADAVAQFIGERAYGVGVDIAADGASELIVQRTLDRFGRVDILVNNAALALTTRFPDLTPEEWRAALEVNLTVPFLLTKAVLPAMRAQQYGRIARAMRSQHHPDSRCAKRARDDRGGYPGSPLEQNVRFSHRFQSRRNFGSRRTLNRRLAEHGA